MAKLHATSTLFANVARGGLLRAFSGSAYRVPFDQLALELELLINAVFVF